MENAVVADKAREKNLPVQLLRDLASRGLGGKVHDNAESIAALSGAYVLLVGLIRPQQLDLLGNRRM